MVDRLHEPPIPENPYPEASPAGRAWFKGLNAGTAYEAPRIVNMALDHADELTRLRARVAELEARSVIHRPRSPIRIDSTTALDLALSRCGPRIHQS